MGFNEPDVTGLTGGMAIPDQTIRWISSEEVNLTVAGLTKLYTVPAGKTLLITQIMEEGTETMGGTLKQSVLKIGTVAKGYAELLGSGGQTFSSVLSSLLNLGANFNPWNSQFSGLNNGPIIRFTQNSDIYAQVSGAAPLSTGKLIPHLFGVLV